MPRSWCWGYTCHESYEDGALRIYKELRSIRYTHIQDMAKSARCLIQDARSNIQILVVIHNYNDAILATSLFAKDQKDPKSRHPGEEIWFWKKYVSNNKSMPISLFQRSKKLDKVKIPLQDLDSYVTRVGEKTTVDKNVWLIILGISEKVLSKVEIWGWQNSKSPKDGDGKGGLFCSFFLLEGRRWYFMLLYLRVGGDAEDRGSSRHAVL
ncbi:hypothetical protein EAE99_011579 [Botrytis elliptica]|nr:hypothetical protein EAE99_011579 [Botrytis elliptica]